MPDLSSGPALRSNLEAAWRGHLVILWYRGVIVLLSHSSTSALFSVWRVMGHSQNLQYFETDLSAE